MIKVTEKSSSEITRLPLNKIKLGENSRLDIDYDELDQLMSSIQSIGLMQPIGVTEKSSGQYEVVFGNRRFLACSKLGWATIPAVVRAAHDSTQLQVENLAENVQRRNLSLLEIGKWLRRLIESGLSTNEASVKLGVSKDYIKACLSAFNRVPDEMKDKVEIRTEAAKGVPQKKGTISLKQSQAITQQKRRFQLSREQEIQLYNLALEMGSKLRVQDISMVARNLAEGFEPLANNALTRIINFQIVVDEKEYDRLYKKHITNGAFTSFNSFMHGLVSGKVSERVNLIAKRA